MIVFDGYITGVAKRHFTKKSFILGSKICLFAAIVVLPLIIILANRISNWNLIWIYILFVISSPFIMHFTKSKKERLALTPRKIYTEDGQIVCIADKYEEIKDIQDVKCVYDYGEFYELAFPFGKISEKFICQKDLLSKGSLEEFEALFEDKIVRKR